MIVFVLGMHGCSLLLRLYFEVHVKNTRVRVSIIFIHMSCFSATSHVLLSCLGLGQCHVVSIVAFHQWRISGINVGG